jgi:hypothetical protein
MTIRYILLSFGTVFPVLVSRTKKNLATLILIAKVIEASRWREIRKIYCRFCALDKFR